MAQVLHGYGAVIVPGDCLPLAYDYFFGTFGSVVEADLGCVGVGFLALGGAVLLCGCFRVDVGFEFVLATEDFGRVDLLLLLLSEASLVVDIFLILVNLRVILLLSNVVYTLMRLRDGIATAHYSIVHLHAVRARLLHINRRILALSLGCLADGIDFSHLNHLRFLMALLLLVVSTAMLRSVSTSNQALVLIILICRLLRSKVLLILSIQYLLFLCLLN